MNSSVEFLVWVKGPAFDVALAIFLIGIIIRLFEILMLGRKPDYAEARGDTLMPGVKTVLKRTLPERGSLKRAPITVIGGYIWHIGFLLCLLLFVPHIEIVHASLGIEWPGLPNHIIDAISAVTIVTLIIMLVDRLLHPVKRFLSDTEDYLVWVATFLPLLTGYLALHRMIDPYSLVLGLHILSVEFLMILFPFTKLMHAITFLIARWFNGAIAGRRGVQS